MDPITPAEPAVEPVEPIEPVVETRDEFSVYDETPNTERWTHMNVGVMFAEVTLGGISWTARERHDPGLHESCFLAWEDLEKAFDRYHAA